MSKSASRGHAADHDVAAHDDQELAPENECESESEAEGESESEGDDDYAPHRDPERLEPVYERFGTLYETANHFGVSSPTIRKHLKRYGLYTPESETEDTGYLVHPRELEKMSPEDVGLPPIGERR